MACAPGSGAAAVARSTRTPSERAGARPRRTRRHRERGAAPQRSRRQAAGYVIGPSWNGVPARVLGSHRRDFMLEYPHFSEVGPAAVHWRLCQSRSAGVKLKGGYHARSWHILSVSVIRSDGRYRGEAERIPESLPSAPSYDERSPRSTSSLSRYACDHAIEWT